MIDALKTLHDERLFYTDIKLDNILYRKIVEKDKTITYSFCLGDVGSICGESDDKCDSTLTHNCLKYMVKDSLIQKFGTRNKWEQWVDRQTLNQLKQYNVKQYVDWDKVKTERFMILSVADLAHSFGIKVDDLPDIMQQVLKQKDDYDYTLENLQEQWQHWLSPVSPSPESPVSSIAKLRF